VRAVVTDNEKKMEVMRRELKEASDDLVVYGCSSHLLNLLGDDLTPQQVTSRCASIERIFSNFGVIQTKLWNRLGIQKAAKLVTCYRELRCAIDLD